MNKKIKKEIECWLIEQINLRKLNPIHDDLFDITISHFSKLIYIKYPSKNNLASFSKDGEKIIKFIERLVKNVEKEWKSKFTL